MFWDFGQPKTFVSRKKDFVSGKKAFFYLEKNFLYPKEKFSTFPKKFSASPKICLCPKNEHHRGTLYPQKSIFCTPKKSGTRQHVGWSFALVIDASSARASRFAHGFLREPHRGVFAPRSLGTIFSLALGKLGLLVDDPFLSPHFQLGPSVSRCPCGLVSLVSSTRRIGFRVGANSSS